MEAFRFSVGTHPCLESRHITCLGLKGITISPTRPEGTINANEHKQQQQEQEEHELHLGHLFCTEGSSVIPHVGNSKYWTRVLYSYVKPPGGLMYWRQANQLSKLRGSLTTSGLFPSPHPSRWGEVFTTGQGPSCTAATISGLLA
jgi:hypothetical protein